ncbi:MAG: [cytidine(C)-cytidine(C)-adenosine (A)]-adding enzyme [Turneriella sp.]
MISASPVSDKAISKKKIFIDEPYFAVCRYVEETLQKHGFEAWLVGGSVRDLLIAGKLSDLDYTTNATPEQVRKIFPRTVPVGIRFGTILVLYRGQKVEITTYRADADYHDGRRPSTVHYAEKLATDIQRRDFTINGLAYNVSRAELADYCGGLEDLQAKVLRTIGDPLQRFAEDGLRPIRGCRIAAKLGFTIEPATLTAMRQCIDITAKVAPERFFDEWRKTLRMKNRRAYWHNLLEAHILPAFLPHIAQAFVGEPRDQFMREIDHLDLRSMAEYAAAVFYLLQIEDAKLREATLRETKFPTAELKLCLSLLASPLFTLPESPGRQEFKNTLALIKKAERLTHVRFFRAMRAASMVTQGALPGPVRKFRETTAALYASVRRAKEPLDISDLAVTGTDIQQAGFKGPAVGEQLEKLRTAVLQNPALNTRDQLLKLL